MRYDSIWTLSVHGRSLIRERAQTRSSRDIQPCSSFILTLRDFHFLSWRPIWNKACLCFSELTNFHSLSNSGCSQDPKCSIVACIGSGKATFVRPKVLMFCIRYRYTTSIRGTKEEGEIILDRGLLTSSLSVKPTPPAIPNFPEQRRLRPA